MNDSLSSCRGFAELPEDVIALLVDRNDRTPCHAGVTYPLVPVAEDRIHP